MDWIFCQSLDAFEGDGLDIIFIIAIFLIHIDHGIPEGLTLCLIVSCSLAESHRCNDCILISGMGADEAAVALLESEEVSAFSALSQSPGSAGRCI